MIIPRQEDVVRSLRYSINVTLDGCRDLCAIVADEELHRHAIEDLNRADALVFGRLTFEMMQAAFRLPESPAAMPLRQAPLGLSLSGRRQDRADWMQPFT